MTMMSAESQTIGGFGRSDRFSYQQRFGGTSEVVNRVLLEVGTASGREPTTIVELRSGHEDGVVESVETSSGFGIVLAM